MQNSVLQLITVKFRIEKVTPYIVLGLGLAWSIWDSSTGWEASIKLSASTGV